MLEHPRRVANQCDQIYAGHTRILGIYLRHSR